MSAEPNVGQTQCRPNSTSLPVPSLQEAFSSVTEYDADPVVEGAEGLFVRRHQVELPPPRPRLGAVVRREGVKAHVVAGVRIPVVEATAQKKN